MSQLLFIGGFPSGGTDLTKTFVNAHPEIYINGEMQQLSQLSRYGYSAASRFDSTQELSILRHQLALGDEWNNLECLDFDFSATLAAHHALTLEEALRHFFNERDVEVWGNKTPQNTEHMAALHALFPQAKFLIVVRDVRDICLSFQDKWGKEMLWCAHKWTQRMERGRQSAAALPEGAVHFIKFEDLLADPESTAQEICRFLQLEFSPRMLEHHKYTTDSNQGKRNYGAAILGDNREKWRHQMRPATIRRVEEIAFQTLTHFGYSISRATALRPITSAELLRGKVNDSWAMVAVGNRSHPQNTLRSRLANLRYQLRKRRSGPA